MQGLVGFGEAVFARGQLYDTAVGKRHQFHQFGIGADQVADDGLFREDHVDGRDVDFAAVAHDVVVTVVARHRQALRYRIALGDEVDYSLGAAAVGQREHLFHVVAAGLDDVMGAAFLRQREREVGAIDGNDLGGAHRLQHLYADVAEAANTDDHRKLPRH